MNTIIYWETMLDKHPYIILIYTTLINLSLLGVKMEVKRSNDMLDVTQFQTRSNSKAFPSCVPVYLKPEVRSHHHLSIVCVPVPCNSIHVEIRVNFVGPVIFFHFYMGSRNWTQLRRLAQQAPLPVEPPDQPSAFLRLLLYLGWSGWPASDAPAVQLTTSRWCCGSPSPRACRALYPLSHLPNPKAYLLNHDVKYWLHCSSTPTTTPPTTGPLFYSQLNTTWKHR